MNISVLRGSIEATDSDTIIVNLFEGVTEPGGATGAVDRALDGAITELIAGGDFKGKAGEVAVLYPRAALKARRVIVVGLGPRDKFDLEQVRRAAARAIVKARSLNADSVATIVHGAGIGEMDVTEASLATVEGSVLALYRFAKPQQQASSDHEIASLQVVTHDATQVGSVEVGVTLGKAIASGTLLARDLVNLPPNYATPIYMAKTAQEIATAHGMRITIGDRAWAAERNMGAFLAVAKGAGDEPRFVVMEHNGDRTDLEAIVLVGKGITFDTGGISIKPTQNMWTMKGDMGGAAAVLGTMKVVGLLNLPLRVIAITPCTENKPDADAYRPSDVITASNGKTIEIISTDAEGRMVLADGLVYAAQYQPKAVIDLATLTGACVTALGQGVAAGIFSTDDQLRDHLLAAGNETFERLWSLPLFEDYSRSIKSDSADIKNSGGARGGVGTSAAFLKEFTSYPWAHLDIAGMALSEQDSDYAPKGGTGYGVRLLTHYLRHL